MTARPLPRPLPPPRSTASDQDTLDALPARRDSASRPWDARGLTATGAVAGAVVLALIGGLVDVASGGALGGFFAVTFVVGCVAAAWWVHREDLATAVFLPPLAFVATAVVLVPFSRTTQSGSLLTREALGVLSDLVLGAPTLIAGTLAAFAVAAYRRRTPRSSASR